MLMLTSGGMTMKMPRIGTGTWAFVIGGLLIALGAFASAGGGVSFGLGAVLFGASFVGLGFWTRLFHLLERRLIDVETAIRGEAAAPEPEKLTVADLGLD